MKSSAGYCMFCNSSPCRCGKPPKVKAVKAVKLPAAPPTSVPTTPKPVLAADLPAPPKSFNAPPVSALSKHMAADDEELSRAITVLAEAELLGEDELNKHRSRIKMPEAKLNLLVWRQRHRARKR